MTELLFGRDSVVVNLPVSQSGGTGFDPRLSATCPGLTKPAILSGSGNLVPVLAGVNRSAPLNQFFNVMKTGAL